MELKFNIDLEKINSENGSNAEAFFKYLKGVSKNKTPIVLSGVKKGAFWNCEVIECSEPTSWFSSIKLPADFDKNPDDTKLTVHLTDKLLSQLVNGAAFTFKDTGVDIKIGRSRAQVAYSDSPSTLEGEISPYKDVLKMNENHKTFIKIMSGDPIETILKEISSDPEGSIFIEPTSVKVLRDTVFFSTAHSLEFQGETMYINMYTANKIINTLDYCAYVQIQVSDNHIIIEGFDSENNVVTKNVSSVFEASEEPPSDEDLESILPSTDADSVELDLEGFLSTIDNQMSLFSTFIATKRFETALYKNDKGLSLRLSNINNDTKEENFVTINLGETTDDEPTSDKFTKFATVLPLSTIKNLMKGNQAITVRYDSDPDTPTVVTFESGDIRILSGKLI